MHGAAYATCGGRRGIRFWPRRRMADESSRQQGPDFARKQSAHKARRGHRVMGEIAGFMHYPSAARIDGGNERLSYAVRIRGAALRNLAMVFLQTLNVAVAFAASLDTLGRGHRGG